MGGVPWEQFGGDEREDILSNSRGAIGGGGGFPE